MIRLSAGTAARLGLIKLKTDCPPETAYLMVGSGCRRRCAFCLQAAGTKNGAGRLGRVTWPAFTRETVLEALRGAASKGFKRICLQGVRQSGPEDFGKLPELLAAVRGVTSLPVSVSAAVDSLAEARALFKAGAERLSIALDAVNPELYRRLKGGSYHERRQLLLHCARLWPGRVSTHIICGLGEREEEVLRIFADLTAAGVTVSLFAFTPLRGTPLERRPPPDPAVYRRLQAACYLLREGFAELKQMRFQDGRLISFGLPEQELVKALAGGKAFQTAGCAGCNRPYYNERPGGFIYNYPRPLTVAEAAAALDLCLGGVLKGRATLTE